MEHYWKYLSTSFSISCLSFSHINTQTRSHVHTHTHTPAHTLTPPCMDPLLTFSLLFYQMFTLFVLLPVQLDQFCVCPFLLLIHAVRYWQFIDEYSLRYHSSAWLTKTLSQYCYLHRELSIIMILCSMF